MPGDGYTHQGSFPTGKTTDGIALSDELVGENSFRLN